MERSVSSAALWTGLCLLLSGMDLSLTAQDYQATVVCGDRYMDLRVSAVQSARLSVRFQVSGSNPRDCQVAENEKLSCGDRFVNETACTETGCCFDRNAPVACYYSNSVTVQCTRDGQVMVVVSRNATRPQLSLNSVSMFGEQSYGSYYTSLDYPVTYVLREPVYVEVRILERTDTNIVLTLDDCWATSTPSPLGKPQWNLLVDGCPYRDDHYLTSLVPVDAATSRLPNPTHYKRCPYRDDNYLTSLVPVDAATSRLPNPTHYKRFVLKMFTFVDPVSRRALKEMNPHWRFVLSSPGTLRDAPLQTVRKEASSKQTAVASSGAVILTAPDARALESWDSEGEGTLRDAPLQTVRKEASSKQTAVASSGAVILTAPDARALESWDFESEVPQSLGYGLMGVAASVVLVVFVLVPVAVCRLKPRVEETKL
ncbi:UNVERIFIED_CONTAM: hypothetical protein FKN15_050506 [Acipenser sinensis]